MSNCKAKQYSDQMLCECGLAWDVGDPEPPECRKAVRFNDQLTADMRRTRLVARPRDEIREEVQELLGKAPSMVADAAALLAERAERTAEQELIVWQQARIDELSAERDRWYEAATSEAEKRLAAEGREQALAARVTRLHESLSPFASPSTRASRR